MKYIQRLSPLFAAAILLVGSSSIRADNKIDKVFKVTRDVQESSINSQARIDELSNDARRMFEKYKTLLRNTQFQDEYNTELKRIIYEQELEVVSLEQQIAEVKITQQRIFPLVKEMVKRLEQFVGLDVPFLKQERKTRLKKLRDKLNRPDLSVGEKYRFVLEAYQIENDYGRTIEAYNGRLPGEAENRMVEFLRIGRLALYYQTLNGEEIGQWSQKEKHWIVLSNDHKPDIQKGLRIAKKQLAPDLLVLPVKTAEVLND